MTALQILELLASIVVTKIRNYSNQHGSVTYYLGGHLQCGGETC